MASFQPQASSYVIAVTGGSGSGKTTLARKLIKFFGADRCSLFGQDNYYIDQSHKFDRDGGSVNFDHPEALDFHLMAEHLKSLREGSDVQIPVYDFASHKRIEKTELVPSQRYILVDGTLILSEPLLVPLFDEAIFLDVDEQTRFSRRLKRDTEERGRTAAGVTEQFYKQVKPMHDLFIEPNKDKCTINFNGVSLMATQKQIRHQNLRAELLSFFNSGL